jgi:hypothetical protein
MSALLKFEWLVAGSAVNVPAVLGLVALAALVLALFGAGAPSRLQLRSVALRHVLLGAAALVIVSVPILLDSLIAPYTQFAARNQSAFVSLFLACVVALAIRYETIAGRLATRFPVRLVGWIAVASLGWLFGAMAQWSVVVADNRAVLASREGLIPWTEAVATLSGRSRRLFLRYMWPWVPPSTSILLAPDGRVVSLLDAQSPDAWQPFNPREVGTIPRSPLFDLKPYEAALARAAAAR